MLDWVKRNKAAIGWPVLGAIILGFGFGFVLHKKQRNYEELGRQLAEAIRPLKILHTDLEEREGVLRNGRPVQIEALTTGRKLASQILDEVLNARSTCLQVEEKLAGLDEWYQNELHSRIEGIRSELGGHRGDALGFWLDLISVDQKAVLTEMAALQEKLSPISPDRLPDLKDEIQSCQNKVDALIEEHAYFTLKLRTDQHELATYKSQALETLLADAEKELADRSRQIKDLIGSKVAPPED